MNEWVTQLSRLAVDRKPIPQVKVPKVKAPKIKRVVSSNLSGMTRKEICMKANQVLQATREKKKEINKERVYAETVNPISVDDICENLGMSKNYARQHLLKLIDEGRVKRYKTVLSIGFCGKPIIGYHYARA